MNERLDDINRKIRTVQAKQNAFPALAIFTVGLWIAVMTFAGLHLNNHFAREALINQEQVSWNR